MLNCLIRVIVRMGRLVKWWNKIFFRRISWVRLINLRIFKLRRWLMMEDVGKEMLKII